MRPESAAAAVVTVGTAEAPDGLELAVMPAIGHFVMIEKPAEFNRLLENAIRELTATP